MIPSINTGVLPAQQINPSQLLGEGAKLLLETATLPSRLPTLLLGEQVTARVADRLDNNQLAVLIKNSLFTLNLPQGATVSGDTLQLKVASLQPALTFLLQDGSKESAEQTKGSSVQVALSPASKYLTHLLSTQTSDTGKPVLVNAAQQPPPKVAEDLQHGVAKSGLFYESHLKDFADGRTSLAEIKQEPQAKMSQALAASSDHGAVNARPQMQELGNLVQRQLNGLENQQLQFQGMAWPGQPMQMVIEQEKSEADREGNGQEEMQAWSTNLSLHLPALGGMAARIRLVGQAVQVSFAAEDAQAGQLITQNASRLESGLASAGLALASLVVKDDGAAAE
ncbi:MULTISPECIES: flagellar hook-length control protein FliK [Chromobacterium]|uniref:Flagellar hook-length control protein FliK n=1 Tax=Chromobacterium aquaticum TaxID=467180 RepID=A0ABV8ZRK0_9NEIS|nr:flagellar hook-length control protein FliK [Chromobacterium aquaticum]MCD5361634.1 flagellar hook-length control protein FliK [Chromobacterium aquaticum]